MRRLPSLKELLAAHRIDDVALLEARASADLAGITDSNGVLVDVLLNVLGPAENLTPERVVFSLTFWPEHVFMWEIGWSGRAYPGGFQLRYAPAVPETPARLRDAYNLLKPQYHTAHYIHELLGKPDEEHLWGPVGEEVYGPDDVGNRLVLYLDYDLLVEASLAAT